MTATLIPPKHAPRFRKRARVAAEAAPTVKVAAAAAVAAESSERRLDDEVSDSMPDSSGASLYDSGV